ncbi:alpha-L-rhamnosidase [Pedobacter sp. ok626]|uniref:alpha-L-rhamnosidase n=1 Tax=Pedobacter sp. ok626 TaxID=1761882 RepID=UPI0008900A84|nr:alpha-L-rhamnosidase [Pedobacter sp. ok626]SDK18703.1 alpha-L-rhamnosidase [Pedobacter sp. ok626]
MKKIIWYLFALFSIGINFEVFSAPICKATVLKCEYLNNPIGLDMQRPRLSWIIADSRKGAVQKAYQIQVSVDSLNLALGIADLWDSGRVNSDQTNNVLFSGKALQPRTKYYWRVLVWDMNNQQSVPSKISSWEMGLLELQAWKGVWINDGNDIAYKPAPYFRKVFNSSGAIKRARAYICGLGYYEMSLNGKKIGNHLLDPGYTQYNKTAYYVTYDVTKKLKQAENVMGVVLGNGWFNEQSKAVWGFDKVSWRERPKFILNLYIEYEDGRSTIISSDKTWKTHAGPIIFNNIYSGEYYDARLELLGWNTIAYQETNWRNATAVRPHSGKLKAQLMPPITIQKEIIAQKVRKLNDSTYLFDFGQNLAGLSRLVIKGEAGTVVSLKHGEKLSATGYLDNYEIGRHYRFEDPSETAQTDIYILKGRGQEIFTQRFTYHGYRYVEVTVDRPMALNKCNLTALSIHTNVTKTGNFLCSNPLLNKIYEAGIRSYVTNLHGIPTDCPQREKNGWTGDGHIAAELGLYNFDGILLYEKWLNDFADAQRPNGELPSIVPTSGWGYSMGGPAWESAQILIPWYVYNHYGDDSLIKKHYENCKSYLNYLSSRSNRSLLSFGLGDWVAYKTKTPIQLTSSCYYYIDSYLVAQFARIVGNKADEKYYSELADRIKTAINKQFFDPVNFTYANGSQTALSIALYHNIVPETFISGVAETLVKSIAANNNHLDVGLLGSKYLLNALSENGHGETAYHIASQKTKPSWGYWMVNGETTFQESWGLDTLSRNHVMFGEVVAWFFKSVAGINVDPGNPGFRNIIIRPHFPEDLSYSNSSVQTVNGTVVSNWRKSRGRIKFRLIIPANTEATVYLPLTNRKLFEDGKEQLDSRFIKYGGTAANLSKYQFKAGKYNIELNSY